MSQLPLLMSTHFWPTAQRGLQKQGEAVPVDAAVVVVPVPVVAVVEAVEVVVAVVVVPVAAAAPPTENLPDPLEGEVLGFVGLASHAMKLTTATRAAVTRSPGIRRCMG